MQPPETEPTTAPSSHSAIIEPTPPRDNPPTPPPPPPAVGRPGGGAPARGRPAGAPGGPPARGPPSRAGCAVRSDPGFPWVGLRFAAGSTAAEPPGDEHQRGEAD